MIIESIDAAVVKQCFLSGAYALDAKKEYINELNVFPVPDGDTGTNMTMTIMSAASLVEAVSDVTMENVCKAISSGSLRGARGNSGVILSQLLRGFTKTVKEFDVIDAELLGKAFECGVESAYKAVMKPKEGTILTVARSGYIIAQDAARDTDNLVEIINETLNEMKDTLDSTPDMLPVLKEAGVVDSGGEGLLTFLYGAFDALLGKPVMKTKSAVASASVKPTIKPAGKSTQRQSRPAQKQPAARPMAKPAAKATKPAGKPMMAQSAANKSVAQPANKPVASSKVNANKPVAKQQAPLGEKMATPQPKIDKPVAKKVSEPVSSGADIDVIAQAEIKYGYCTEFIILLDKEFTADDEFQFKRFLESIGDSIVCVADDDIVKVHVHTNDPGFAFQKGLSYGQLTNMKVDNMREEHNERLKLSEAANAEKSQPVALAISASVEKPVEPKQVEEEKPVEVAPKNEASEKPEALTEPKQAPVTEPEVEPEQDKVTVSAETNEVEKEAVSEPEEEAVSEPEVEAVPESEVEAVSEPEIEAAPEQEPEVAQEPEVEPVQEIEEEPEAIQAEAEDLASVETEETVDTEIKEPQSYNVTVDKSDDRDDERDAMDEYGDEYEPPETDPFAVSRPEVKPFSDMPYRENGFISVSVGDGLGAIFKDLGVDFVIEGGQTMNPSTNDIITAIEMVNSDNVFILPNNGNIIMAAQQAASIIDDKKVMVIPTKNLPQGITAMINFVEGNSPEDNEAAMIESLDTVKSGQITYAVRDAVIDGHEMKSGDIIGLTDKNIEAVGNNNVDTTLELLRKMIDENSELVTIYYGEEGTEAEAELISARLLKEFDNVEVEIQNGGQPVYYYLVSVE